MASSASNVGSDSQSFHTLWKRARIGSERAVSAVMRQFSPVVYQAIRRRIAGRFRSCTESEDIAQSVWCSLLTRCSVSFTTSSALAQYVRRMAKFKAIDRIRLRRRESIVGCRSVDRMIESLSSKSPKPDEVAELNDLQSLIEDSVPIRFRNAIRMRVEGASVDEIANELGVPRSTLYLVLAGIRERMGDGPSKTT